MTRDWLCGWCVWSIALTFDLLSVLVGWLIIIVNFQVLQRFNSSLLSDDLGLLTVPLTVSCSQMGRVCEFARRMSWHLSSWVRAWVPESLGFWTRSTRVSIHLSKAPAALHLRISGVLLVIHWEIFLIEVLYSWFVIVRLDNFLNATGEWSLGGSLWLWI